MSLAQIVYGLGTLVAGGRLIRAGVRALGETAAPLGGREIARVGDGSAGAPLMRTYEVHTLDERVAYIREMARKGQTDPRVRQLALTTLTKKCGEKWCVAEKDYDAEVTALFDFVRSQVRYTHDILNVDTFTQPARTLTEFHAEDCDGLTATLAALLMSVGYYCRFRVIREVGADEWGHIFLIVAIPPGSQEVRWVGLDASVDQPAGWVPAPSVVAAYRDFEI